MKWTEEQYATILTQKWRQVNAGASIQITNLERPVSNEPLAKKEGARQDTRCCVTVHSRTNRLADPDGRSCKAALDGLTKAGILVDDSATFIREVRQTQEKVKGNEETVITIEWD